MVNSEELIGTAEYLTLQARYRINRCRYNRVRPYYYATITVIFVQHSSLMNTNNDHWCDIRFRTHFKSPSYSVKLEVDLMSSSLY